jgi:hypothetical protein
MVVKVPYGWKKLTRPAAMRFSLNHTGAPVVHVANCCARVAWVWPGDVVSHGIACSHRRSVEQCAYDSPIV